MEQDSSARENDMLMACLEIGKLLTSTWELGEILALIMHKISNLIKAHNWSLLLVDSDTRELVFEIVVGEMSSVLKGRRLAPGAGIAGYVAETGVLVIAARVAEDPRFNRQIDHMTGFSTRSIICLPLKVHEKVVGVIEIVNAENVENFEKNDLPILNILADYAAISIENSQYYARIQQMSITDEYTGLFNARYLHRTLEQWTGTGLAHQERFAVVFVDLDDFKSVVDGYGHLLGSQVLREVGQTIRGCLSPQDILVKYGGDEYVILLLEKSKAEAVETIEKVIHSMRTSAYLNGQPVPVRLTASFGIALYPDDARTRKDLLLLADRMMYDVKNANKNGFKVNDSTR